MSLRRSLLIALLIPFFVPDTGAAYLKLGVRVGDRVVPVRWQTLPVRYFVADGGVPGVGPQELEDVLGRAVETWQNVPGSTVRFEFAGRVQGLPTRADGISVLGFEDRPELDRVLGATRLLVNTMTGEILEADVFFNARFGWSVAPGGEPGRFDLESIAVHEIGHLLGLGHSAVGVSEPRPDGGRRVVAGGTAMFPIAFAAGNIDGRTLQPDDVAGASDLYPTADFRSVRGSVSGTVTRGGRGLVGAHVTAFNAANGELVGGFTLTEDGEFAIAGLEPGPHVLRIEPLDSGEVESFFDRPAGIDVDFRATFFDRLLLVTRGGDVRADVQVRP